MSEQYREDILVSEMTPVSEFSEQTQAGLNVNLLYINASEVMREMEKRMDNGTQYTTFPNRILELEKKKLEDAGYIVTRNYVRNDDRYGEGQLYVGFQVALNSDAATKALQMVLNDGTPGASYTKDETDALLAEKADNDAIGSAYDPTHTYVDGEYLVVGSELYRVDSTGEVIPIVEPTVPVKGVKVNLIELFNELSQRVDGKINSTSIAAPYDDTATYAEGDYLVVGEDLYKIDSTGSTIPGTSLTGKQVDVMSEVLAMLTLKADKTELTTIDSDGNVYVGGVLIIKYLTQTEYDLLDPPDPRVEYNIIDDTSNRSRGRTDPVIPEGNVRTVEDRDIDSNLDSDIDLEEEVSDTDLEEEDSDPELESIEETEKRGDQR